MLVLYLSMLHFKSEVNGVTFKAETSENETYTEKNVGKIYINFSDSQIQKQKFKYLSPVFTFFHSFFHLIAPAWDFTENI